jgi:hypothetical protein
MLFSTGTNLGMIMPVLIDETVKEIALRRWMLPACLHVPVAAIDESAIRDYIGDVEQVLAGGSPPKPLLVQIPEPPAIDALLPISDHPNAGIFHARRAVGVSRWGCATRTKGKNHVDSTSSPN